MGSNIIKALRDSRKAKKIRITNLATQTQISEKHISQVLGEKVNPTLEVVEKLAKALDVDIVVKNKRRMKDV